MALQQDPAREGLDRAINVLEDKQSQHQAKDAVLIAAQPIEVAVGAVLGHEQHDRAAAVERLYREQIECAQQEIERERCENEHLSKRAWVQPALVPSCAQKN